MRTLKPTSPALFPVDTAQILSRLVEAVDVAHAVAVGDPYIAIATIAFFTDCNPGGGIFAILINGQPGRLDSHDGLTVQRGFGNFTRLLVCQPKIVGILFAHESHAVSAQEAVAPRTLQPTIGIKDQHGRVGLMKDDNLAVLRDRDTMCSPIGSAGFVIGNSGPTVD